jgi:succinate dehydrogenase / fumarate reductase, flavoprotein subunit
MDLRVPSDVVKVDADVLVVGGGFAGVWAALRAATLGADVVLVEKAYVSRSGASTMSGGVTTAPLDGDDLSAWLEEFVVRGTYMADQKWTRQLLEGARERVKTLDAWGIPISKDEDGNIRRFSSRGMVTVRCLQYQPKTAMEELRRRCLAAGVRILDRINVADLITSDGAYPTAGAVCGAVGFHVRDGTRYVFHAKRTILACGAMAMKGKWHIDNVACDGIGIAYRAGARVLDLELGFGGTFVVLYKHYNLSGYNVAVAHGAQLINARGERFMAKYDPVRFERSELARVIAAFVKELVDGRGPCYLDLRTCDASYWRDLEAMKSRGALVILSDLFPDPREHPMLVEPSWGSWSHGISGIDVDISARTTLDGLLAAGSSAKNKAVGTHSSAGSPTAFAMNSGYIAGERAARDAKEIGPPRVDDGVVAALVDAMTAPLHRRGGALTPDGLHDELSRLESSVVDGVMNNGANIERRLLAARALAAELDDTRAADVHDLVKLCEARNVIDTTTTQFGLALDRTESRETFYREDYPETDDAEWFAWHGATRTAAGPRLERIPIPLDGAPFPPRGMRPRHTGAIAAMMMGNYDVAVHA